MPCGFHEIFKALKALYSFYNTTSRYIKSLSSLSRHSFTIFYDYDQLYVSVLQAIHSFIEPKYAISTSTYSVPSPKIWQEILIAIGSNTIAMILQWLLPSSSSFCSLQQQSCISISLFERRHGLLFLYLSEASVRCSNRETIVAEQANVFCVVEYNGYIGRAVSSRQTPDWTLGPYIVQAVLLLVAPALFAATIYMELGRIITLVDGEHHSIIKKRWLTKTFVCGDIVSFLMQSGGIFPTHSNWKRRWADFIRC